MNTRDYARQFKLIECLYPSNYQQNLRVQTFNYLFVLDFEATCWEKLDPQRRPPEIIEFPVVLYDVRKGEVLHEFQEYVKPSENPILSDFCIELTGIKQNQVDNGIPLPICMKMFNEWVEELKRTYKLGFFYEDCYCKAAFVTWSDWDLGTCLRKECRRKGIENPLFFTRRIDLRDLYVTHYNRRPKGLHGALTEVGLEFEGREHCGLHDARNTAKLAGKMISDGILLELTK